jgi:hypothetical protein
VRRLVGPVLARRHCALGDHAVDRAADGALRQESRRLLGLERCDATRQVRLAGLHGRGFGIGLRLFDRVLGEELLETLAALVRAPR